MRQRPCDQEERRLRVPTGVNNPILWYKVGKMVYPDKLNENQTVACSAGINVVKYRNQIARYHG